MAAKKQTFVEIEPIKYFVKPSFIVGKKYYLYAHTRNDNNDIIYFGIGTIDKNGNYYRALCHRKRNILWKRIINKVKEYNIFIIDESDNKKDILDKEIAYIKLIGKRKDKSGTLSNLTDGGEGLKGHKIIWTDEMRAAASTRLENRIITEQTRLKLRNNIYKSGLVGRSGKDSYIAKVVLQICPLTGNQIGKFYGCAEAARYMNVKAQSINNAVRFSKKCKHYFWRYE